MSTYRFIERQRRHYAVRELCQVLGVAPSAYYTWRQRRQRSAPAWERAVCQAFARHAQRYSTRRLRAELQAAATKSVAAAFGACYVNMGCGRSSPARSCPAPPTQGTASA